MGIERQDYATLAGADPISLLVEGPSVTSVQNNQPAPQRRKRHFAQPTTEVSEQVTVRLKLKVEPIAKNQGQSKKEDCLPRIKGGGPVALWLDISRNQRPAASPLAKLLRREAGEPPSFTCSDELRTRHSYIFSQKNGYGTQSLVFGERLL